MTFIYFTKLPFFEKYRINPDKEWPWEEDSWPSLRKKVISA